ncbi:MAG TPA: non-ribosomal peptide synthetase [Candidatus Limnocylindrales bacterium]|nr:non-ribosomal peptide synthetase [Candidatus Limnocylindrales bacterium]
MDNPEAPAFRTLAEAVQHHARTRPHALAVAYDSEQLTYAELNACANQWARMLQANGVCRGALVGIHLGRSIEWVVATLAVLKAGAASMPLDPGAPAERMARALQVTRPPVILTGDTPDEISGRVPAGGATKVLTMTLDTRMSERAHDLSLVVEPDDLAYAVHTSGSAGQPKIVLAQHRWLTAGASGGARLNRTTPKDRGSWLGAAGAGIAVHEVSSLLWVGASIHIGSSDVIASPPALRSWLLANRITQSFVITPVGEVLQSLDWPEPCPLRLMTLGGDKLNQWAPPRLPFEVTVAYGSLEAFQVANSLQPWDLRCTAATATAEDRAAPPPVGRPLPGVRVHVLEHDLSPSPDHTIGELWISSASLALGYLGDPAQTADRFRPNPFDSPGSRLYRSGDAGRFRTNGILEHHGRIDDVVKVRGHRVEFGEIEWVLASHPRVTQACVAAVKDDLGTQLVACIVGEDGATPGELRSYVAQRLPDFMVPVAYVRMDRLPVNTSNKVDRRSLPPADWRSWRPMRDYRSPQGEVETGLATMMAELFALPRVGADDNFMELGGDSLLAARLRTRIEEAFGVQAELVEVMNAANLGALALYITTRRTAAVPASPLPPILPRNRS